MILILLTLQKRKSGDKLAAVTAKAIGELERPSVNQSNVPKRSTAPARSGQPPSIDPPAPPAITPPMPPPGKPKPAVGFSLPAPPPPSSALLSEAVLTKKLMNKIVIELSNDIYDMSRVDAIDCVSAMERFPTLLDLWVQTVKQLR